MKFAYLFPGQGSQSIGMMADLAASFPEVKQTFVQGSDILQQDLWKLATEGPEEELNQTENTQPLMLCASMATHSVWSKHVDIQPELMAGHSFGEYSALVCANAIDFEATLPLAKFRGQVMQQAVPVGQGAMAAILGLENEKLAEVCAEASQGQVVEAVNFNAPGQIVIAGDTAAVARAIDAAKEVGAKRAVTLPLSVPSHSSLMQPAAEKLKTYLEDVQVKKPDNRIIHNVDVQAYEDADSIKDALYRQLFNPVRWVESIEYILSQQVDAFIELGPGKVLTGLCKRIDRKTPCFSVHDAKSLDQALENINAI